MIRALAVGAAACGVALGFGGTAGMAGGAAAADGAPAGTATLTSEVIPGINALNPTGPTSPAQTMHLAIAVAGPGSGNLNSAYQSIYTPGSPNYHHFLTTAQVADEFGATPADWSAVQSWATSNGFHVDYASGNRDLLEISGAASSVEHTFGVQLNNYQVGSNSFVANTAAPTVPANLGITNVVGLNTLDKSVPSPTNVKPAPASGQARLPSLPGPNIGTQTPQELWGAYNQPASNEGQGETLGVLGNGASSGTVSDLHQFEQENNFPQTNVKVDDVGPGPFTDTSGAEEWDIDTQAEDGMAPQNAGTTLYFGSDLTDPTVAALFSAFESDTYGPQEVNASFGECEANPIGTNAENAINPINNLLSKIGGAGTGIGLVDDLQAVGDPILQKATLEGKTLFSSAGDTGSSCPAVVLPVVGGGNGLANQGVPFPNYPSISPYAVGVGGTTLYTNGSGPTATRAQESAWSFGGGGDSLFIPQPAYQNGVSNINLPCISTPTGAPASGACRGGPDVSALSGDALTNAYAIVSNGADSTGAGTSLSSPLWAGMWARVQSASPLPNDNGFANETFYRLGKNPTTYGRDFYDITTGIGGVPAVGNGLYPTEPGWDYATGWGAPNVTNLIADADG